MSITDCDAHFFGGNNMYQCILSDNMVHYLQMTIMSPKNKRDAINL